jgi:dihydrofolate synthase / folylpolyglutamate synthase
VHFSTLSEWLSWIASIHITEIELGLDRVKQVAARLNVLSPSCPVIIVGGTNGKGSSVAGLEAIYRAAQYHVGAFTSPFLFKHNEQVRIDGVLASDEEFCWAFEKIEAIRGDVSLTPFEFCTLAALLIFKNYKLDVLILEVGLGGRLDAVNIIDADVAVVTSIAIDHVEWLGSTREVIAREKAGIFRTARPAVCGDDYPPASLLECAARLGTPLFCQGRDFHYQANDSDWSWSYRDNHYHCLPRNALALQNMSTVLMAITLLDHRLPVRRTAIDQGLATVTLTGRIEVIKGPVTEIYDVSHNPAAIALLTSQLKDIPRAGKTHAVFSMLADKDIAESIRTIRDVIDAWYVAPLPVMRAAPAETLSKTFQQADIPQAAFFSSIKEAYETARGVAETGDYLVIFGSFHTVAEVLRVVITRNPRAHISTLCTRK